MEVSEARRLKSLEEGGRQPEAALQPCPCSTSPRFARCWEKTSDAARGKEGRRDLASLAAILA